MSATNTKPRTPPLPPVVKPLEKVDGFCFWVFHLAWSKWQTFEEGTITRRVNAGTLYSEARDITIGYWIRQRRTCTCCGLEEIRFQKIEAVK